MRSKKNKLSSLPQIEALLQDPSLQQYINLLSRPIVTAIARSAVNRIRHNVLHSDTSLPCYDEITQMIQKQCTISARERLQKVINASGIVIHTNMGRSPIGREIWDEAADINCGYSNLELDLYNGKRGKRKGLIPDLLRSLLNCEDALVVNNNAAAVFLILQTLTSGKEVIVSRGEQVQIGGGIRIPDILKQSGAKLVETGTTNITSDADYLSALSEDTAMILSVHRSNFAIRGFSSQPSTRQLATIKPDAVILCVDQGSGVVDENLPGEISVRTHLRDGADLVCFSGDKVVGGPQAGIIVGKKELIARLEQSQLMRTFRPGKTIYSLLEATLIRKLNGERSTISATLSQSTQHFKRRGEDILEGISSSKACIVDSCITTGGGSAPDESFPSLSIRITAGDKCETILQKLRDAPVPIIAAITDDMVHLNLATIRDDEAVYVREQLHRILGD